MIKRFSKTMIKQYNLLQLVKNELKITETLSRSEFILNLEGILERNEKFEFIFQPIASVFKYKSVLPTISENILPKQTELNLQEEEELEELNSQDSNYSEMLAERNKIKQNKKDELIDLMKSHRNPNRKKDLVIEKETLKMLVSSLVGLLEINELGYTIPDFGLDHICKTQEGIIKVFNMSNLTKHGEKPLHSYPSQVNPPEIKQKYMIFKETLTWIFM